MVRLFKLNQLPTCLTTLTTTLTTTGSFEEWKSVRSNAQQILTYLSTYNKLHALFSRDQLTRINKRFTDALNIGVNVNNANMTTPSYEEATRELVEVMMETRDICRSMWAQFDVVSMLVSTIVFAVVLTLLLCSVKLPRYYYATAVACMLLCAYTTVHRLTLGLTSLLLLVSGAIAPLYPGIGERNKFPRATFTLVTSALLLPLALTANSFVLAEDTTAMFVYASAALWSWATTLRTQMNRSNNGGGVKRFHQIGARKRATSSLYGVLKRLSSSVRFLGVIVVAVVTRMCRQYFICRPEQLCYEEEEEEAAAAAAANSSSSNSSFYV